MPKEGLCVLCVHRKCPVKTHDFFKENTVLVRSCSSFTPQALADSQARTSFMKKEKA